MIAAQLHRIGVFFLYQSFRRTSIGSQSSGCIVSIIFSAFIVCVFCFPPFYGHLFFSILKRTQSSESFHIIDSVEMTFSHLHCVLSHFSGLNRKYYICYFKIIAKRETLAQSNKHLLNFKAILLHSFRIWRANRFHLFYTPWPNILLYQMCLQYTQQKPLYVFTTSVFVQL